MEIKLKQNTLCFKGILDESVTVDSLTDWFEKTFSESGSKDVSVDFTSVKYANSAGILAWIKALTSFGRPIVYLSAPTWLVLQFNMVPQLINNENSVVKIQVPFYNTQTEEEKVFDYTIGKEIPILDSYDKFDIDSKEINGETFVPDFIPERYFDFIVKNKNVFKQNR